MLIYLTLADSIAMHSQTTIAAWILTIAAVSQYFTLPLIVKLTRYRATLYRSSFWGSCYSNCKQVAKNSKQWITFKVSELEMHALETYCQQTQRTKTDLLREMIRKLPTYSEIGQTD